MKAMTIFALVCIFCQASIASKNTLSIQGEISNTISEIEARAEYGSFCWTQNPFNGIDEIIINKTIFVKKVEDKYFVNVPKVLQESFCSYDLKKLTILGYIEETKRDIVSFVTASEEKMPMVTRLYDVNLGVDKKAKEKAMTTNYQNWLNSLPEEQKLIFAKHVQGITLVNEDKQFVFVADWSSSLEGKYQHHNFGWVVWNDAAWSSVPLRFDPKIDKSIHLDIRRN